ncbi:MAG: hypothetical protein ACD_75C02624G0003 [uncultured bacterium]|nr:MAG: hypothetical protein ACD_75C02624G0003 [uncultured bacterium]
MQSQTTNAPVSEANTVLYYLERVASKLAAISHLLNAGGEIPRHTMEGTVELVEEARNTIFEACHFGEIVRAYVEEKAKPLAVSMSEMLKEWIDNADEKTANQLVLFFCDLKAKEVQPVELEKSENIVTA